MTSSKNPMISPNSKFRQLTALVKACSGVLIKTDFSLISDRILGHTLDPKIFILDMSNIENFGQIMSGLFKVSQERTSPE